jgi:hypothetical protein
MAPTYRGTSRINRTLSYKGLDEQLRKLENFENIFVAEMTPAVGEAIALASEQAKTNAPEDTGQLKGQIYSKMLGVLRSSMTVRGALGVNDAEHGGFKAFAQETGRWYTGDKGRWHKTGRFYLYYGAKDKANEIMALYQAANERIVQKLAVQG